VLNYAATNSSKMKGAKSESRRLKLATEMDQNPNL